MYKVIQCLCKMLPRIQGFFNFGSEKRAQTSDFRPHTREGIEDDSSSGENIEIEDKPMPSPETQLIRTSHSDLCGCTNCDELISRFSECGICLEPYQNVGACVCACCGGMWCARCTKRVTRCAFCRTPVKGTAAPCPALKRLINELRLPCRNNKRGCDEFLTASTRDMHEEDCKFDSIACAVSESCLPMSYEDLGRHFYENHKIISVYSPKIKILIEHFQEKLQTTVCNKSKYKIVLFCEKSAFFVKVSIVNYHVRVEVMRRRLGYIVDPTVMKGNYGALIEFQGKTLFSKLTMRVGNETYSKRAEIQWNNPLDENSDEEITVHVNIIKFKR